MKNKISLIIPSISRSFSMNDLLTNICLWSFLPSEIVIVNTSGTKIIVENYLKKKFDKINIRLNIINKKNLYPGAARNLGILNSKFDYILFLDMNTVPYSKDWLKNNFDFLLKNKLDGLCGQTYYMAETFKEKLIRASTYGRGLLRTIPGSIFSKKTINDVGKFNSVTRAGEDTEWLQKLNKANFKIRDSIVPIYYKGLYNVSYSGITKKWFRNYSFSANLPHLAPQKYLYLLLLFFFFIFVILNWNSSNLNLGSALQLFISKITKITLLFSILFYLIIRGIYIPLVKKIKLTYLLPYNIFLVTFFSFILDSTKLLAFSLSFSPKRASLDRKK